MGAGGDGEALAMELAPWNIDVTVAEPGPTSSGLLEHMQDFKLDGDPYGITSPITPDIRDVAAALADLLEAQSVPLRAPIGDFTKYVIGARAGRPTTPRSSSADAQGAQRPVVGPQRLRHHVRGAAGPDGPPVRPLWVQAHC
jgi:NAD(P)-dependent dehydrogenase (short-subunit alcohol dehydrogenase family)